jgi:ElaB/YqjD/DUF883 family membrane-anchored ribosome-binding protein
MAAKNTLQFFLGPLLKKFFQDMGRSPNNLEMILIKQKAGQLLKESNKVIQFPQKESFMKQVESMKKSGDLVDIDDIKISEKITDRDMFKNSSLNKNKSIMDSINEKMFNINKASKRLDEIMKEREAMFKPKTDAEIKAKFDKQNKEAVKRLKEKKYEDAVKKEQEKADADPDYIMKIFDPEDMAEGGRIGFSGGKGVMAILKNLLKPVKPSGDDLKEFLSKRQFLKDMVGNTEKNRIARDLQMLKEAMDEARKNSYKFPEITREEIEKKIGPILLKGRDLNATGGRARFQEGGLPSVDPRMKLD